MSASRRVRNTGAVPVFGLTLAKSSGESWEGTVRVNGVFDVVQEESTLAIVERPFFSSKGDGAELESRVHVREEGRQISPKAAVLEVKQAGQRPLVDTDLKNFAAVLSA